MANFLKVLILGMALAISMGWQVLDHVFLGTLTYETLHNQLPVEELTMPVALMASHVVCDHYFQEGSFGTSLSDEVAVNGVFSWVGYLLMGDDQKKKDEYVYVLFWTMLPDLPPLKPLFHTGGYTHIPPENPIFGYNQTSETLLMGIELISLKIII